MEGGIEEEALEKERVLAKENNFRKVLIISIQGKTEWQKRKMETDI